ncbi:MAG TPA: tRNA (N6-threonylcarbamoyladenosine(37)-N6)-methyltransferase TrmO, partial [Thermodesulfobacteriota bacterium]|nr:tRNA (N6-threonylcarbamoyladenosine(37)-N6)-methyltransferase TrmO [Thermodesulfobacteriota bacterium]
MRDGWESLTSEIVLDPKFTEGLEGVTDYSHIFVLFWISRIPKAKRGMLKIHPRSRSDLPLVGIFATRTQYRPNPIGLTLVRLMGRKENILRVKGLDALDGTPVLDIKPISPRSDMPATKRVPAWYRSLWRPPGAPRSRRGAADDQYHSKSGRVIEK